MNDIPNAPSNDDDIPNAPLNDDDKPLRRKTRPISTIVKCLTIIGVILIMIACLLPARRETGAAARRAHCQNNLKQIVMALRSYESTYGAFPPAYTVDSNGKPLHSWRTLILPFLNQQHLYDMIDLSKPWYDPLNAEAFKLGVNAYQCPESTFAPNFTTYLAVVTAESCLRPKEPRKLSDITDKTSETLIVIEVASNQAVPWMSPRDADEKIVLGFNWMTKFAHAGGINVAFVDGSVRSISAAMPIARRLALISIAGNDNPGDF